MGNSNLLVTSTPPLAINGAKPSNHNVHGHLCVLGLTTAAATTAARRSSSPPRTGLAGSVDDAHDLGVAHLEVTGAVGGGLGADLGMDATQLVPPAAVDAQQREAVS